MLVAIARGGSTPFRVKYVIRQGPNKGHLREYNVYYGAPNPKARTKGGAQTTAPRKRHIESGNIPFTEFGSGRMLTLFSYNIIMFNGKEVIS